MIRLGIGVVAGALALVTVPAVAQSNSTSSTVTLAKADDYTWTVNLAATNGTNLPGTLGTITYNFLSANTAGTLWNFSYSVDNTSIAPSGSSRLGVFGFDTSPTLTGVTAGASQRFDAALNGGNFNGLGDREVCFFSGPNCNGSGNNGVTVAEVPVAGTFSLSFSSGIQTLVLENFVARWQATGAQANGSNSGGGTIVTSAVPEPASWAMMIVGFGLIGGGLRHRKPRLAYV